MAQTAIEQESMTTGGWFWTLVILAIPLVGFIMTIVWACGVGNWNRVTFCRATLLLMLVAAVIWGAVVFAGGRAMLSLLSQGIA